MSPFGLWGGAGPVDNQCKKVDECEADDCRGQNFVDNQNMGSTYEYSMQSSSENSQVVISHCSTLPKSDIG